MPYLHESNEYSEYIFKALINKEGPIYKWDPIQKLYKYSNTLYPNKNYKKTFDPKSFMNRGDVIHFEGDSYRNNYKMIFDGEKLQHLDTNIDDYGAVPPDFVVGDNEGEFNIGDFEELIDHNNINWLSRDKLKEIKIYEIEGEILGEVKIRNKKWIIYFEIYKKITNDNNTLINNIKKYINDLIENYDDIKKRHPFIKEDKRTLSMFLNL